MSKDTRHLVRAGVLLAAAVVAIVVFRIALTPKSFGEYGYFRGDNVTEWASHEPVFAATSQCNQCHSSNYGQWQQNSHATVSCENCHGPGERHIRGEEPLAIPQSSETCLICHEKLVSRPAAFPQVESVQHAGAQQCIACHNPHSPAFWKTPPSPKTATTPEPAPAAGETPTAKEPQGPPGIPHTLEGRSNCTLCHQVKGGIRPMPEDHSGRTSEVCLACHKQEKP